ncbi:MAG: methyl-accepting chemotaxis protein [Phycisphaerae bacterium]|nr:methyl-accepting chemotaxis protein [Phycisphaerae bacterium]
MKIRGKLVSLVVSGVVLVGVTISVFSIITIKKMGNERIAETETELMEQRKAMLTVYVDNAYTIAEASYNDSQNVAKLTEAYQGKLSGLVEVVYKTIETIHKNYSDLSEQEQKKLAIKIVKEMRYEQEQYFWINDLEANMIMHPIIPSMDGTSMKDFTDPTGKKFFVNMVEVCKKNGEGMVDYMWPKPGEEKPVKKISYVKLYEPWGWIIGTGVYMESTEGQMQKKSLETINTIRYEEDKSGYLYVFNKDTRKMLQHAKASLVGTDIADDIYTDPDGKKLLVEQLADIEKTGDGFTSYKWPKPGENEPIEKITYAKTFVPWNWVISTGAYVDDIEKAVAAKSQAIAAEIKSQIQQIVISTVLICIVLSFLTMYVANKIAKPIKNASDMLKDIAQGEGDLTKRLVIDSNDEMGELSKWFNVFVEKIQNIIIQITGNAAIVSSSSTELSATAAQMSSGAEEMTNQSVSVSAAAEEMSVNMVGMAKSTEEMSASIRMVAAAVEEMTASVSEIASNAEQAATVADEASVLATSSNEKIDQLGLAADEIGKVIEVIQDIAEQTNLLALNATIEAARAGDAGKGFAVVANEVKELAKQTAEATNEISERIGAIQSTTTESVESISKISEVIKKVNDVSRSIAAAVEEQSATTGEIAQSVSSVATVSDTVSRSISESASASQEITKNITGVDAAARQTAQSSAQTQVASTELSKLSEELHGLVGQFKV